ALPRSENSGISLSPRTAKPLVTPPLTTIPAGGTWHRARQPSSISGAMKYLLEKLAEAAGAQLLGNGKTEISGIASLESATADDLVFVESADHLGAALQSAAAAVVAGEFARGVAARKPLLIARQPRLAFVRAGKVIFPPRRREPGIASTAFVHDSVKMGKLISVEPGCYIG